MESHAEQRVERYCELVKKDASSVQQEATPCMDDRRIPPEDYGTTGELSGFVLQMSRIAL